MVKPKKENFERFNSYAKGSKLLIQVNCTDCNKSERNLINLFVKVFKQRLEFGNEYFEGDCKLMLQMIFFECYNNYKDQNNISMEDDFNNMELVNDNHLTTPINDKKIKIEETPFVGIVHDSTMNYIDNNILDNSNSNEYYKAYVKQMEFDSIIPLSRVIFHNEVKKLGYENVRKMKGGARAHVWIKK